MPYKNRDDGRAAAQRRYRRLTAERIAVSRRGPPARREAGLMPVPVLIPIAGQSTHRIIEAWRRCAVAAPAGRGSMTQFVRAVDQLAWCAIGNCTSWRSLM